MFYTNDPYFQVKPYEIPVRGLTSEVQLFHMSDLHLIVSDENSTPEWQEHAKKSKDAWQGVRLSFAKLYGDSCDEAHLIQPEDALPKYVSLVNEKRPHALLMTGDMLNDFSSETIDYLGDALSKVEIPWMWVRGNHELGNDEAYLPYTGNGALIQTLQLGNLTLIGIDNSPKKVSAAQAQAVKAAADKAKADGNVPTTKRPPPSLIPTSCWAVGMWMPTAPHSWSICRARIVPSPPSSAVTSTAITCRSTSPAKSRSVAPAPWWVLALSFALSRHNKQENLLPCGQKVLSFYTYSIATRFFKEQMTS